MVMKYAYEHEVLKDVLLDIVGTPISPELIPPKDDKISQVTEDVIGPYFFHDFIIYNYLRYGYSVKKLYFLACNAFMDRLSKEEIKKYLGIFFRRYFRNQFKRNCLPDGVKIGSVSVSPRGDLRLPSDLSIDMYLKEIEELE